MKKQSFSLVELIVIIVIVAIAAGILLPMIAQAQKSAKNVSCTDKLKGISEAAYLYVWNHNDNTVPHLAGKLRGWTLILMNEDSTLTKESFHCPDDKVKRGSGDTPISYSLNIGHIWNCRQSPTNKKEWGPASVLSGNAIRMSKAPQPSDTTWFFENHDPNNSFRKMWNAGDRSIWGPYSLKGFHENSTVNNMLFMDGHVDGVLQKSWVRGDNRGIIFKDIHSPANCTPNIR
jgi:prepilin-type processing-associated H-X9-DG protein